MTLPIKHAADILLGGGIIAYPTDGVFGLGCMPDDTQAVARLLEIKQRDPAKGLILIAAEASQFTDWVSAADLERLPLPDPDHPITWVTQPGTKADPMLRGEHPGIAVRITTNPVAAAICARVESPIISTSANLFGRPVVRNRIALLRTFESLVDYVVPGDCGPATGASEIRRLEDSEVLRPGTQ